MRQKNWLSGLEATGPQKTVAFFMNYFFLRPLGRRKTDLPRVAHNPEVAIIHLHVVVPEGVEVLRHEDEERVQTVV